MTVASRSCFQTVNYVYWIRQNCQQIDRINAYFQTARRFGLCSSTCLCDVSEYLRLADCRLCNHIQSPSHCLSHLLPPKSTTLAYVLEVTGIHPPFAQTTSVNPLFIPRCLFYFLWFLLANVNSSSCSLYVIGRPSVCLSSVCNVHAPYSGDWNFRQYFYNIWYAGHLLTSR